MKKHSSMKHQTTCALNSTECEDALDRFTQRLNKSAGYVPSPRSERVPNQIAAQMESVNSFMDTIQHLPFIGALFLKTT